MRPGLKVPVLLVGGRLRRSTIGWHSLAGYVETGSSPGYDGRTFQIVHTVEAPIARARAIILCNEASGYTLNAVAVSESTTLPVGRNPTGGSWKSVTFGGSASVAIPARIAANQPSRTVSDWITVSSVAPTDGTTFPYMFWRGYYATGPATLYKNTSDFMATGGGSLAASGAIIWPDAAQARTAKRIISTTSKVGDFVSSNQSGFTTLVTNFGALAMEFEYEYAQPVVTVTALGDSITQGDVASLFALSPIHYAVDGLSASGRPIVPCNQGFSSRDTSNNLLRLQDIINSGRKPNIIVYSAWSPNDTFIVSGNAASLANWGVAIALMKSNLAAAIALCAANNIFLVISTATPYAFDTSHDALRVDYNNYLRGLAGKNIAIVDYDAVLSDGATPAKMQTAYTDGTSGAIHPYDAGYIAMGAALKTVLQSVLSSRFNP